MRTNKHKQNKVTEFQGPQKGAYLLIIQEILTAEEGLCTMEL